MTDAELDDALAGWLRSGTPGPALAKADAARVLHRIDLNGIAPLLAVTTGPGEVSDTLARALRERLVTREMWEAQHRQVLGQALDALNAAGLHPVLMKGTALAWTRYSDPALRVRGDSDILVDPAGSTRAIETLARAGFTQNLDAGGEVRVAERLFCKADMAGKLHDIDLHWALNNSAVLAGLFRHDEILAASVPVPALWSGARAMSDVQALLFACVHRLHHMHSAHSYHLNGEPHEAADSLIWLMDIHLLFNALSPDARTDLVQVGRKKGVLRILATSLRTARARLGTEVPDTLLHDLEAAPAGPIMRYFDAPPWKRILWNLAATPGTGRKLRFVTENLFPDPEYMRRHFADERVRRLPWLYLRRGLGFVGELIRARGRR